MLVARPCGLPGTLFSASVATGMLTTLTFAWNFRRPRKPRSGLESAYVVWRRQGTGRYVAHRPKNLSLGPPPGLFKDFLGSLEVDLGAFWKCKLCFKKIRASMTQSRSWARECKENLG